MNGVRPILAATALALAATSCKETETKVVTVPGEIPACSAAYPSGACPQGEACFLGACVASSALCGASNTHGQCQPGFSCYFGGCIPTEVVPPAPPAEPDCDTQVASVQPVLGFAQGKPTGEGGAPYTYDHDGDPATAPVEVPYQQKTKLTVAGQDFRDLNGNGTLERYEDWRYSPICRARDLVSRMALPQKLGLLSEGPTIGSGSADGTLSALAVNTLAAEHQRQALIRPTALSAAQYATFLNNVQAMAEGLPLGVPFVVTADPLHGISLSTNAGNGKQYLSTTPFPTPQPIVSHWPFQLGLAAINDPQVTFQYGDTVRREFRAQGFHWELGPQADLATEPRWARVQSTFGENAHAAAIHVKATIEGFQAGRAGGLTQGIAATLKHFPGGGPEEDGKDNHQPYGKWNVFPGDNFDYHVIPFAAGVDAGAAAVMPCYSIFKGQTRWDPDQVGAGFSRGLLTGLLRDELGFDGLITGDWGIVLMQSHGVEALTMPERAAMALNAGLDQFGFDYPLFVAAALQLGLVDPARIDAAAAKVLEMSFKLGLFENPYADPEAATAVVRSRETMLLGLEAQKKAIVLLKNDGPARLPLSAARYTDRAGGTPGVPDAGEFDLDSDRDGTIEVWFDGVEDALSGEDPYSRFVGDHDHTAAAVGSPGSAGYRAPIAQATSAATADVVIARISARKGLFGGDYGVPLSFDRPFPGVQQGFTGDADGEVIQDRNRVLNLFRLRDGYVNSAGTRIDAVNPGLRIVLVMNMDRPSIVKPFVNGLTTLDELPGVPGSYPLVSEERNVNRVPVLVTGPAAHAGVDVFLVEFGAYDRAVLDFVFGANPIAGWAYGSARLPMEIPSSDEEVEAQLEDVPADSWSPTYLLGAGMNLPPQ